jgi:hypothetical protein
MMEDSKYGFVITRHVRDTMTNRYWNECVQSIRRFYPPSIPIVIVDDRSDPAFLSADAEYQGVRIIDTPPEWQGAGEMLAFLYYYKEKWFEKAVILHDSVFFQKRIRFDRLREPVLPLWHFSTGKNENKRRSMALARRLTNHTPLLEALAQGEPFMVGSVSWMGCFGLQCVIRHSFLAWIERKYRILSLVSVIKKREDRCCLERVWGVVFSLECPNLRQRPSLLGNIYLWEPWGLSYPEYKEILRKYPAQRKPLMKVWTGR